MQTQCQVAADPQTKPVVMDCESAGRLLPSTLPADATASSALGVLDHSALYESIYSCKGLSILLL